MRRTDGTTTTRRSSFHHGCPVPKTASIRVTLTFAALLGLSDHARHRPAAGAA